MRGLLWMVLADAFLTEGFSVTRMPSILGLHARPVQRIATRPMMLFKNAGAMQPVSNGPRSEPCMMASKDAATAVYGLILVNLLIFAGDKILRFPLNRLYLYHAAPRWWQLLTACFCHANRAHLSGNVFLLLLFGRSVEDDLGWGGLTLSYAFCGIVASLVSLAVLPVSTVSLGWVTDVERSTRTASGSVFGLFAVSTLAKLSWRDLDWRKLVELCVLGEFVFTKVVAEARTAAMGGVAGINHVAHLSGAAAGVALIALLRWSLAALEGREKAAVRGLST